MSMEVDHKIRAFEMKRDLALVNGWALAHGRDGLPHTYLPPDGAMILNRDDWPVAAGWVYKALGVGVAFVEHVHTAPGLSLADARAALAVLVEYFRFSCRQDGYGVLMAHTLPALAREAERQGWSILARDRVSIGRDTGLAAMLEGRAA